MAVLSGYLVLNCTNDSASLCIKTLAGMGAEAVRVDPENDPERFRDLIKQADILVETSPPGFMASLGFGYPAICKINPRLIMASITPFGQSGPYKDFKAGDLTLQALGGWLSITGEPDKPLKLYGSQAYNTASLFAANGIMLALLNQRKTGKGEHIDIAILECVAASLDQVLVRYFYDGIISRRQGSRHWNNAFEIFRTKDGYILLSLQLHWETLVEWLNSEGMAAGLMEEKWRDREERNKGIDHIIEILGKWTLQHNTGELVAKGQLMHFPWAEVKK
jgi:crotonobetainyl-CoA:carnitine CoA-transferase CaiB-like acyl-CoA transferase